MGPLVLPTNVKLPERTQAGHWYSFGPSKLNNIIYMSLWFETIRNYVFHVIVSQDLTELSSHNP